MTRDFKIGDIVEYTNENGVKLQAFVNQAHQTFCQNVPFTSMVTRIGFL